MTTDTKPVTLDLRRPEEALATIQASDMDPSLAAVLGAFFGSVARKKGRDNE